MSDTFMTFGLGEGLFALPVALVQEILDTRAVARLPKAPPALLGLIDVRGTSVAVLDLRRLLGEPPRPDAADTRFVVLHVGQQGRSRPLALRVDRVIEVTPLDHHRLEAVDPAGPLRWSSAILQGIGRRHGAFVAVLQLDALLSRLHSDDQDHDSGTRHDSDTRQHAGSGTDTAPGPLAQPAPGAGRPTPHAADLPGPEIPGPHLPGPHLPGADLASPDHTRGEAA